MNYLKYISFFIFFSFLLSGCNFSKSSGAKEDNSEESAHTEEIQTITELTEEQIKTVGIEYGTIEIRNILNSNKVNGVLRVPNSNKAVVTAIFGGVINSLLIQEGDKVKKGQVIATVSNPEFINVQEQYLVVKNQLVYAEQEVKRQQELFDNGAGAKKNLQSAVTQFKDLRTQMASLTKRLQLMGLNVSKIDNSSINSGLRIVAPISGTISSLIAQVGTYVDVTSSLAEIIDNSAIRLDLKVFEKDIPNINIGQLVEFTLVNFPGKLYKANVYQIGSAFDNVSKTITVYCRIEGDKSGLIDGMNAVGAIGIGEEFTFAVPLEAVVDDRGKSYIFVKTDKEIEHQHEVDNSIIEKDNNIKFEKVEVVKGAIDQGYISITPIVDLSKDAIVVLRKAFFVNAKMNNTGEHEH